LKLEYDEESGDCHLTIDEMQESDAGAYRCVASNPLGSTNTACNVGVKSKKEEVICLIFSPHYNSYNLR